ncbi:uncharacterized protein Z520_08800 [Fonsecaea multimorphosa CBS 102226]|uniref:Fe2OG dioxygenase domain-containing protein n=1 Tax=Fonsecaea multimorphosa CBS 102226 TaxID=1442371 RepID=A0A0D2KF03_9EURO|nr:uncharacterized protein Z520_08800 [Fonsecaea multimorphosa CBS 102226]KIX95283.1 hypothetical protein Z520_08800 [Fonsecaea multimorphosa CBS 102226]OAL21084.1 hypothetical protein AYO22_08241 [Fonsecaea multimorphosa]
MLFEPGSVPPGPPIETKKALILLDFQNDFVKPSGNLPVANVEPFIPNLLSLVDEFRAKGQVIWAGTEYRQSRSTISSVTGSHSIILKQHLQRQEFTDESSEYYNDPNYTRSPREDPLSPSLNPDVTHDREAFLAPLLTTTKHRCCMPGSSGADYSDGIKAAIDPQRDLVMLKSHYSAFQGTSLLMHLRTHLVTELYVCGSLSNVGVYATVLDAVCHGVQVTLVEDCLGYIDEACHIEAMRQMADAMGANGIDCQELRDDIAGLLGDIIHEEDYPTRFQVSLPPPSRTTRSHTSRTQIHDWISSLEGEEAPATPAKGKRTPSKETEQTGAIRRDSNTPSESSRRSIRQISVERSPTRKRSTSDLDPLDEERVLKLPHNPSSRRSSTHAEQLKTKQTQQHTRKRRPSQESSVRSATPTTSVLHQTLSTGAPSAHKEMSEADPAEAKSPTPEAKEENVQAVRKKKKMIPKILGPGDTLGQGDCKLHTGILDQTEAEQAFYSCRSDIKWQKMFHRSGEVPRLVAVQGSMSKDGTEIPIYRHPADESPELLPFDAVVSLLRGVAEKIVGHPLNHVLIQWYRHCEDNISEHSDKTLDIVRGSQIVNVSLGAQRTMMLRAKKSALTPGDSNDDSDGARPSQRIPLPHNSLFVLGQETNRQWLHSIRADKRPLPEKTPAELAFDGERISFTFRHVGTFINLANNTIWGQGATSKKREDARPLLTGAEAEKEGEAMIRAFGQENHRSADWNWDEWYGRGFDVVNFETKSVDEANAPNDDLGSRSKGEKRKIADDSETSMRAGSAPF